MRIADRVVAVLAPEHKAIGRYTVSRVHYGEFLEVQHMKTRKTLLHLPGGAFLVRVPNAERHLIGRICEVAGANAAIVHYRLSPEQPFPAALEDALDAYRALLADGIRPQDIIISGDSAGGGLALSTAIALRDENVPMPAGLVLLSPLTDLTFSGNSRQFNRCKDPMLPASRSRADARYYFRDNDPKSPLISPVFADYAGLPPILAQVGSDEILLDDTRRVAERANTAGTPIDVQVWKQMPHVWQLFAHLPESREAIRSIGRFINRVSAA